MSDKAAQPEMDPATGDIFGLFQSRLGLDMMQVLERLPTVLARAVEGNDEPVALSQADMAEVFQQITMLTMKYLPQMAGALDMTRARLTRLERRLAEDQGKQSS